MRSPFDDLTRSSYTFRDVISPISPCGLCRQVIREFCTQDMPIFLVPADYPQADAAKGGVKETSIGELLPDSFGPEQLELPECDYKYSAVCISNFKESQLCILLSVILYWRRGHLGQALFKSAPSNIATNSK